MKVVIALGGNALLQRGEKATAENQMKNADLAAKSIAEIASQHDVVVVHGNGPQVGLLALQSEAYSHKVPAYPLDILNAESQGMIGYMIQQKLAKYMKRNIACVLTQVLVDKNDSAFSNPTKPIGLVYSKEEAESLAKERGWVVAPDGDYYRRVVASPIPKKIVELDTIKSLSDNGILTVCVGGGGIPVVFDNDHYQGVEAVIDKDRAASLLAKDMRADCFIILTDVEGVFVNWGKPDQKMLSKVSIDEMSAYSFASGSMGPKVEAATNFVSQNPSGFAVIGNLANGLAMVNQEKGTIITI